ncbi:hypothetical protein SAMN02910447_01941 [Ruminococcus sp. YE71]|uniref:hypothetical protein n=1 Tax=unclassified Ruminococcus TaxID=2608920 RepID=UPI0008856C07|nr:MULTISPECIES: hypothetical protein [unclassified Ruminococcus]SDA28222.1 hypothetical protein SAMN02910446_02955 [Ruminococcus sp. YE78]SFW34903.1 hypothetical protein SAMN02910447_01941 [Ruminococcus sp. YE71]
MNANFKKKIAATLGAVMLSTSLLTVSASARSIADGDLDYSGGQTDSYVYSEVSRRQNVRDYMVKATVKVGGNTYTSGWKKNYAYKQADRKWYANETSYYDYYRI